MKILGILLLKVLFDEIHLLFLLFICSIWNNVDLKSIFGQIIFAEPWRFFFPIGKT